jgi:hypothetical protein
VPDSDLDKIESSGFEPPIPDETAELEKNELDTDQKRETKRLQNLALQLQNTALEQDIALRKDFAWDIFYLIVGWLSLVFVVLGVQGFAVTIFRHTFHLSDSVVLALIGGTTVNVLGIFIIVVRYLFPSRGVS